MLNYDETMRLGAHRYADALTALTKAGIHAAFTQTGGMNAAMCAVLERSVTSRLVCRRTPRPATSASNRSCSPGIPP